MKVEQTICDECKRQRGESNHWQSIGVLKHESGDCQLTLGVVPDKSMPNYSVHDICGAECFHRHIDRLLGKAIDPPVLPAPVETWRDRSAEEQAKHEEEMKRYGT